MILSPVGRGSLPLGRGRKEFHRLAGSRRRRPAGQERRPRPGAGTGGCAALRHGMHPHGVVAKSTCLRFRLRRKLRPLPCSSAPRRDRFAGSLRGPKNVLPKRKRTVHGVKEKARLHNAPEGCIVETRALENPCTSWPGAIAWCGFGPISLCLSARDQEVRTWGARPIWRTSLSAAAALTIVEEQAHKLRQTPSTCDRGLRSWAVPFFTPTAQAALSKAGSAGREAGAFR